MQSTLVLNASYEPLNIVSAQRAITLILKGKAVSIDDSPRSFNWANGSIEVPYVIKRLTMVHKEYRKTIGYSHKAVLFRDNHKCVYCGRKATTVDHVFPKSLGGKDSYENCVAACTKCNGKKSNKLLETMGWELDFKPTPPSPYVMLLNRAKPDSEHYNAWKPHFDLFMNV